MTINMETENDGSIFVMKKVFCDPNDAKKTFLKEFSIFPICSTSEKNSVFPKCGMGIGIKCILL